MNKGLGFRLESMIGHQERTDPFVVEYDKLLDQIREKVNAGYYDFEVSRDDTTKQIQNLINDRFNCNVELITNVGLASVIPFFASDNNVFMRELFRQSDWLVSEKDFMSHKPTIKGWVDLTAAKLGGDYSKGKSTLYMNYNRLMSNLVKGGFSLTNKEIIAVTLHEQGHIFYPLVYANQIDKANIIFQEARMELTGKDKDKRNILHQSLSKINKSVSPKIIDDLCSDNPEVYTKAVMKYIGEQTLSHQVNAKYSNTNFEMMADNFATRFGLGKELVKALEKMVPGGARYGDVIRAINETLKIVSNIMAFISLARAINNYPDYVKVSIMLVINAFLRAVSAVVFFYVLVRLSGEGSRDYTYDDLVVRYNRIRMQIISDIKTRQLSKKDAKQAIETLEFIGKLVNEGRNWRTPLDFLFNTLNPSDSRAKDSIGRQQALEKLINNDLFIASLKLNQLAA